MPKTKILRLLAVLFAFSFLTACGGGGGGGSTSVAVTYPTATDATFVGSAAPMLSIADVQVDDQAAYTGATAQSTARLATSTRPTFKMNFAAGDPVTAAPNAVLVANVSAASSSISYTARNVKFGEAVSGLDRTWTDVFDTAPPTGSALTSFTFRVKENMADLVPTGTTVTVTITKLENFSNAGGAIALPAGGVTIKVNIP